MLWNIVKGVVAAVLVTKITERYFKDKSVIAGPAQSNVQTKPDLPSETVPVNPVAAKPRTARKPAAVKLSVKPAVKPKAKPAVKQDNNKDSKPLSDPLNATESTI